MVFDSKRYTAWDKMYKHSVGEWESPCCFLRRKDGFHRICKRFQSAALPPVSTDSQRRGEKPYTEHAGDVKPQFPSQPQVPRAVLHFHASPQALLSSRESLLSHTQGQGPEQPQVTPPSKSHRGAGLQGWMNSQLNSQLNFLRIPASAAGSGCGRRDTNPFQRLPLAVGAFTSLPLLLAVHTALQSVVLLFSPMGYGCRGTGRALCQGTRCHSTTSSATHAGTAQAGHGVLNNPFLLLGHPSGTKSAVLHEHWGRRVSSPALVTALPSKPLHGTSLIILVAPRMAQPPEEPSCHHGNAAREGLKPAGTSNLCQEKQGP